MTVGNFTENVSLEKIFSTISGAIYEHNHVRPHQSLGGATPYQSYNNLEEEVKAKMEAFKRREKKRKSFKITEPKPTKNNSKGVSMPAYLVNEDETIAGFVKSFIEIKL
ncbi:MAG: hypothetical protein ACOCRX_04825 [Candidatus Woesearchaeota archaeon]